VSSPIEWTSGRPFPTVFADAPLSRRRRSMARYTTNVAFVVAAIAGDSDVGAVWRCREMMLLECPVRCPALQTVEMMCVTEGSEWYTFQFEERKEGI
jgi:hypothetical protein